MSIKVMRWVWDHSRSKNAARLVMLAVADNAADDGSHAYPTVTELRRKCQLSESAVQAAVNSLIELGELTRAVWGAPGTRRSNMYRIIMRDYPPDSGPPQILDPTPPDSGPPQILDPTPPDSGPLYPPDSGPEPSLNHPKNHSAPTERAQDPNGKSDEPNAGSIVADWIDYCGGRGITLTKQAIGRYAKKIKDLIGEGFSAKLIKRALALQLERGKAAFPGMLDGFVNEIQGIQPATSQPARQQYQTAAEKGDERRDRAAAIAQIADELQARDGSDPRDPMANMKITEEAQRIYDSRSTTCNATGYTGPDRGTIVDAEWTEHPAARREVTAG